MFGPVERDLVGRRNRPDEAYEAYDAYVEAVEAGHGLVGNEDLNGPQPTSQRHIPSLMRSTGRRSGWRSIGEGVEDGSDDGGVDRR